MRTIGNLVTVVTGASSGIGASIARVFAGEGARLVVCGRDRERLAQVAASLKLPKTQYVTVAADIREAAGMHAIVQTAITQFGRIDIFVNNAGVGVHKPVQQMTDDDYDMVMETNLKAVFYSLRELIPIMQKQGGGQIINVSSGAGRFGTPGMAVYAASKAALNILSESVAGEVRNENIKISVLAPGSTDSAFAANLSGQQSLPSHAATKLTVDEVAEGVLFLAKQNSNAWTSLADIRPLQVKK